jgi:heme-degrading monooxygenase HmoA
MAVYTLGLWRARSGQEDGFIAAWEGMARATKASFPTASAVLLRDRDDPKLFISFGPWESLEEIDEWRASRAFTDGVGDIRSHLEGFEPHTMDVVVSVE